MCSEAPHCISLTSSSHISNQSVSRVTGVGSSHHEGGSSGCVHCSIGGGFQGTTVNSYEVYRQEIWKTVTIHDLPVQVGTGSHILLAIQVAIAVMSPSEIRYPGEQV